MELSQDLIQGRNRMVVREVLQLFLNRLRSELLVLSKLSEEPTLTLTLKLAVHVLSIRPDRVNQLRMHSVRLDKVRVSHDELANGHESLEVVLVLLLAPVLVPPLVAAHFLIRNLLE